MQQAFFMMDWSIRLGDIIVLLGLAGTSITLAFKAGGFARSIEAMQGEITGFKEVAKAFTGVLTTVAVQKSELDHLRHDLDDLKRGRGFITNEPKQRP